MKIIADKNIPLVEKAFAEFGEVVAVGGRTINRDLLLDAGMLLARSTLRIDRALLDGTSVRFVATATIGTDHVDTEYLRQGHIGFASAPGSNANSVAEYVVSALFHCARKLNRRVEDLTLGIVGVGHVGLRVHRLAQALGVHCLLNDPPKQRLVHNALFVPLDDLLPQCDVVSLHVPLAAEGPDPTFHLVDERFIDRMKKGAMLFNTSRGAVVDEGALRRLRRRLGAVVLDVWEEEPAVSPESVSLADIATPHIAGHSYDGKVAGCRMIYEAACAYHFKTPRGPFDEELDLKPAVIDVAHSSAPVFDAVMHAYPIADDDVRMREVINREPSLRAEFFDSLRQKYHRRLEFRHYAVKNAGAASAALGGLGFQLR